VLHLPNAGSLLLVLPIPIAILAGVLVTIALWPRREPSEEDIDASGAEISASGSEAAPESGRVGLLPTVGVLLLACSALIVPQTGAANAASFGGLAVEGIAGWS